MIDTPTWGVLKNRGGVNSEPLVPPIQTMSTPQKWGCLGVSKLGWGCQTEITKISEYPPEWEVLPIFMGVLLPTPTGRIINHNYYHHPTTGSIPLEKVPFNSVLRFVPIPLFPDAELIFKQRVICDLVCNSGKYVTAPQARIF